MKRTFLRRGYLAVLVIFGVLLAGCGDTATPEAQADISALKPMAFDIDNSELSVQAPGDPVIVGNFVDLPITLGVNLPEGNIVMRHFDSLARLDSVTTENSQNPTFRADATWQVVAPLAGADETCFSFESRNFPGFYLRHSASRLRIDPLAENDTDLFRGDATWCSRLSLDGATEAGQFVLTFESFNFPGYYMRRFDGAVWLSQSGGPLPSDNPDGFSLDASWDLFNPLTP